VLKITENHNFDKEFFAMKRLCLKLVLAMLFCTFLSVGNSEAQGLPDLSLWNSTNWKITTKSSGYYFPPDAVSNNGPSPDGRFNGSYPQWGRITSDIAGVFTINTYDKDTGGSCSLVDTLNLTYIAGSALGFIASYEIDLPDNYAAGLLYISGKLDKAGTAIQIGKIEPLGEYVMASEIVDPPGGDRIAYKVDLKGKKVSELGCTLTQ
jgi:hypothetical protein